MAITRDLMNRFPSAATAIPGMEPVVALHGSGRNSVVLHAGFYHTADPLKAGVTRDGNRQM